MNLNSAAMMGGMMGMNANSMNMMMYNSAMMGGMNGMMNFNNNMMNPYSMALNTTNSQMLPSSSSKTSPNKLPPNTTTTPSIEITNEDPNWEERYTELQTFKREHGHTRVPARYKPNPKLGRWVMTQRRQFTVLMQGFPSALTTERMNRLNDVGFVWALRADPVTMWNRKFGELKGYKRLFGNCMVPQRYQRECICSFLLLNFYYCCCCSRQPCCSTNSQSKTRYMGTHPKTSIQTNARGQKECHE